MADYGFRSGAARIIKQFENASEERILAATYIIHRELLKILKGPRTGIEYPLPATSAAGTAGTSAGEGNKPKKTKYYTASSPDEPPAVRLGDLRTSYRNVVIGTGTNAKGVVGSPLEYAYFLEHGTSKMAPRVHLKLAFERTEAQVAALFEDML